MNQSAEILPNPKAIALIANITQLMDEVEQVLRDSNHHQNDAMDETDHSHAETPPTSVTAFLSDAGRKIAAGARRTDRAICAHPYQSLAIALGAGALLGVMLVRRNLLPP